MSALAHITQKMLGKCAQKYLFLCICNLNVVKEIFIQTPFSDIFSIHMLSNTYETRFLLMWPRGTRIGDYVDA